MAIVILIGAYAVVSLAMLRSLNGMLDLLERGPRIRRLHFLRAFRLVGLWQILTGVIIMYLDGPTAGAVALFGMGLFYLVGVRLHRRHPIGFLVGVP